VESRRQEISSILQIPKTDNLGFYLGLPTHIGRQKVDYFTYIKERVTKRIQEWKEHILSRAGKEMLIKAVVQAIPTYVIGCYICT